MNELIDPPALANLVGILTETAPGVRSERTAAAAAGLGDLNLRARTDLVAGALAADLRESSGGTEFTTAARSFRAALSVSGPRLDQATLTLPGELRFAFEIANTGTQDVRLAVDYLVHYRKANGTVHGRTEFLLETV
ncbi:hypothetical protein ARTHRO9AX_210167 [Arthrobacter sp. 9AX]|uniref:hypothetical protein n=1 Tax=Arthrobacter sp. 9AX TaxID=2653131 RepID=UPI0012F0730F|nr:hypothetical protein [Arthrobacter sp. 9AX]VXC08006.1 hypothetical protein ARTHRO9AX_210167 [Arthrobacter sp. 9AX]